MTESTPEVPDLATDRTGFRLHVDDLVAIAEETARTLLDADIMIGGPTVGAALLNASDGPQRIRGLDDAFADRVVQLWETAERTDHEADVAALRVAVLQTLREATPTT